MRGYLGRRLAAGSFAFVLLIMAAPWPGGSAEPGGARTASETDDSDTADKKIDPLSVNATCYVCHIPFVREAISRVHFAEKITCIKCHGLSAAHANDEDIGATKPDIMYTRDKVDRMCSECHESHDVPAKKVLARFVQREITSKSAVCTDCHGNHRIEPPAEEEVPEHKSSDGATSS